MQIKQQDKYDRSVIRRPVLTGLLIILIFLGGFATWALLAPLESAAIAPGTIVVDSERKSIQHLEGGIVKDIYIKEGSHVDKGDWLIKLDDTQALTEFQRSKIEYFSLLAKESRLISERDKKSAMHLPPLLMEAQSDPKVDDIITGQQHIFYANSQSNSGRLDVLQQRVKQLEDEMASEKKQAQSEQDQLKLIKTELNGMYTLLKDGYISKSRVWATEREASRLEGEYQAHIGRAEQAQQRMAEAQLAVTAERANIEKSIVDELRVTQRELSTARERYNAADDILKRTLIKAPESGSVMNLQVHTKGGVVKPGQDIMSIVPEGDSLVIEAHINPIDIDVVHKGLTAKVQLSAFSGRNVPVLQGKVVQVSADVFENSRTGQSYYEARVMIDADQLSRAKGLSLYAGMPVQLMIITDKQTPFKYFAKPVKNSFERAFREQ